MKVEIYSDIGCPWCYIGKARFEKALAAFPDRDQVEVVYKAYQLNPDFPADPAQAVPHDDYLLRRFGPNAKQMSANVTAVAADEGLEFHTEKALIANSFAAHRLIAFAEREGGPALQKRLVAGLFKAQFTDGGNVSDTATLEAIAREAGLDGDRTQAFLASDALAAEVEAQLAEGRMLGITGVPTFVFEGKWGVSGAQEAETFLKILEQVNGELAADTPTGDAHACEDGACTL